MTAIKTETRGRKFNASRYAIVRAWEIANNAAVAHLLLFEKEINHLKFHRRYIRRVSWY